jgi:hypothetical protein
MWSLTRHFRLKPVLDSLFFYTFEAGALTWYASINVISYALYLRTDIPSLSTFVTMVFVRDFGKVNFTTLLTRC